VFDLPVLVARDEGLFEQAGIALRYSADYDDRHPSERDVLSRLKEVHFEQRRADVFNVCEWGSIDRLERGTRGGKIAAWRAAVTAQAILSHDEELQEPRDLANVPIGVNEFTGSHYTTLQLLEGSIARDQIVVEHAGSPEQRYRALRDRQSRAVTLMEPFISLALEEGAHLVGVTFYRGSEVISPDVGAEQRAAYLRAIDAAVDRISGDFALYKHYIVRSTQGALRPEELSDYYVRYTHVRPYPLERFTQAYEWMQSWGLSRGENEHATLVVG
jgi:NitT/TauT family transport system substrate-binding protein